MISLFIYFFNLFFITKAIMALLTKLLSNGKSFYQQLCSVAFGYDVMMYSVYFRYHAVMLHIVPFFMKRRKGRTKKGGEGWGGDIFHLLGPLEFSQRNVSLIFCQVAPSLQITAPFNHQQIDSLSILL